MKKIVLSFILLNILVLNSCQKVIDVDLNESEKKIVIEANYIATDSVVNVLLTNTSSFFQAYSPDFINDATVVITDGNNVSTTVPFVADGMYTLTSYAPTPGMTYTITVSHGGVNYSASSSLRPELIMQAPYSQFFEQGFFGEPGGYLVFFRFQDPVGQGNYYNVIATANGTIYNQVSDFAIGDDELTDGNLVERPIFTGYYAVGDTISYELQAINKKMYDYYSELQTIAGGGQDSAAPANPTYFWSNKGLGYFSAYYYTRNGLKIVE